MQEEIRVPRPRGTTEISSHLSTQKNRTEDYPILLKELQSHVIEHYINTNYTYCHHTMDIITFCNYTNIPENDVHQHMINRTKTLSHLMEPENLNTLHRELLSHILSGALNDRQTAVMHQSILLRSQGGDYKPFISSEVTKALKLTQESNAQILSVIKSTMPTSMVQFNTQNNYQDGERRPGDPAQGLTVDQALELIQTQPTYQPLLEDQSQLQSLKLTHNLDEMPEVRANYQQGVNTAKEGLDFTKIAELSDGLITEDSHIDRRANELDIDLDADQI